MGLGLGIRVRVRFGVGMRVRVGAGMRVRVGAGMRLRVQVEVRLGVRVGARDKAGLVLRARLGRTTAGAGRGALRLSAGRLSGLYSSSSSSSSSPSSSPSSSRCRGRGRALPWPYLPWPYLPWRHLQGEEAPLRLEHRARQPAVGQLRAEHGRLLQRVAYRVDPRPLGGTQLLQHSGHLPGGGGGWRTAGWGVEGGGSRVVRGGGGSWWREWRLVAPPALHGLVEEVQRRVRGELQSAARLEGAVRRASCVVRRA